MKQEPVPENAGQKINWFGRHRLVIWGLVLLVFVLAANSAIFLNLRALEFNRSQVYRSLELEIGQTAMNYVLSKDDFQNRKGITIFAAVVINLLLIGILFLLYMLGRTNRRLAGQNRHLRQTQAQLHREEKTKSLMISAITHSAIQYLTVLDGSVQNLLFRHDKNEAGPANLGQTLKLMKENTRSLNQIIENLNDHEKLCQGHIDLLPEDLNVVRLIRAVLHGLAGLAAEKNAGFDFKSPDEEVLVRADPHRAEQVIMNLVHNAVKFSPFGGRIDIWLSREAETIKIFVRDQGSGIEPKNWENIFEPFVRLHKEIKGTGLGLSTSRNLIRLMGGELGVAESTPGRGATFFFTLPESNRG